MANVTYDEAIRLFETLEGDGSFAQWQSAMNKWGQDTSTEAILQYMDEVQRLRGVPYYQRVKASGATFGPQTNASGSYSGYAGEFTSSYAETLDSNVVVRGSVRTPINTTATVVEETSKMSFKVGLREAGKFAVGSVVPAIAAAGVGITLGKSIDSALYDAFPDFWNSHNMSSLDPSTWNSITTNYDGTAGTLFDLIFGLDGDKTQAYLDEDALAYLAKFMLEQGVFDAEQIDVTIDDIVSELQHPERIPQPLNVTKGDVIRLATRYSSNWLKYSIKTGSPLGTVITRAGYGSEVCYASTSPFTIHYQYINPNTQSIVNEGDYTTNTMVVDGVTIYYMQTTGDGDTPAYWTGEGINTTNVTYPTAQDLAYTLIYGTQHKTGGVDGISSQDGAQLPDTTGWDTIPNTKQSLQQQYPDLWNNAKHQDYVDENGQNKSKTLIPINLPNAKNPTDTKPTTGDRSQSDPQIDPDTATRDLIDTITDLITTILNPNPPDTGTGDSPITAVPVGQASSLWKIYNPTQAQVDSFGAWLWSSNFVEQIKKLFNDPMQGIIGIHKVFATPSIGGSATIKVGYLDSEVPSNWVDNQYTTINCGTINLSEYFGNVFDYSPYTKVSLYLPFIGIVDLDVADVMRSSIKVTYHVDVLSGACLADVKVSRDNASAVLYQYSGSAIVTYPVSSGNYMGMVAGTLSVAAGLAGTILSGGALAPALVGGAVGMSHLHTDVSHSGGFSGCAGAMAGKKPYLIISRPITAMADNYKHFTGQPANTHVTLNSCSGFTKVKSVYVGHMQSATDEEKDMIEAQLKAGVLI